MQPVGTGAQLDAHSMLQAPAATSCLANTAGDERRHHRMLYQQHMRKQCPQRHLPHSLHVASPPAARPMRGNDAAALRSAPQPTR